MPVAKLPGAESYIAVRAVSCIAGALRVPRNPAWAVCCIALCKVPVTSLACRTKLSSEHQLTPSPLQRRSSLQPSLTGSQQSSAPSEEALNTVRACRQLSELSAHACFSSSAVLVSWPSGLLVRRLCPLKGAFREPRVLLGSTTTADCAGTLCVQAVGHLESIVHSPAACAQYSRIKSASQSSSGGVPLELVGPQVSLDLMRPSSRLRVG